MISSGNNMLTVDAEVPAAGRYLLELQSRGFKKTLPVAIVK